MNEIKKLYELAGIEYTTKCSGLIHCEDCEHSEESNCYNKYYSPFTPEKQLELIKFWADYSRFSITKFEPTNEWVMFDDYRTSYDRDNEVSNINFEECLASWIIYIWEDLTKEEQAEIRKILEG